MEPDNEYFEHVQREAESSAAAILAAEDDALEGPEDGPEPCLICGPDCDCAELDAAEYALARARGE